MSQPWVTTAYSQKPELRSPYPTQGPHQVPGLYSPSFIYPYPQSGQIGKPTELVQYFRFQEEYTSAQERCLTFNWYGLDIKLARLSSGNEGSILLAQIISTCRRGLWRGGGGHYPVERAHCPGTKIPGINPRSVQGFISTSPFKAWRGILIRPARARFNLSLQKNMDCCWFQLLWQ